MAQRNQAQTIAELTLAAERGVVAIDAKGNREFIALPDSEGGYTLEQITQANAADVLLPKLVTQHVRMQTAESLSDYLNRFQNEDSVLFADIATDTIAAIVDYHGAPSGNVPTKETKPVEGPVDSRGAARLGLHRATLVLPKSLEWQTWNKASGTLMSHLAFASFLEENSIDIKNPVGADLLELCRDLQVLNNVTFGGTVRDGDYTTVNYAKESDAAAKGGVQLPQSILLSIPVYFGEQPVPIMAFMRRKIDDGDLLLGIQLSRAENVRQMEFHRIVDAVTSNVNHLTTVYGTPA